MRDSSSINVKEGFHAVGYIKDAHSLKGEVYVRLFAKKADWLKKVSEFYLSKEGQAAQTLKLLNTRVFKDGLLARFEGVNDRNQAEALRGYSVQIPASVLVAQKGEALYLGEVLNFRVLDSKGALIGVVCSFANNGAQDLLVVKPEGSDSEILIPFIQAFIIQLDFSKQEIKMDLPEGLLEVNEGKS